MTPKILYVDLEASPNIADVWRLWDNNVGLDQLRESTRVIGFAAKFQDERRVKFYAEYDFETRARTGQRAMIERAWELYDQADVVVSYNGDRYDHLHFAREWVEAGITPPSPFKSIDLCKVVKRRFKFPSNKLDYVAGRLLGEGKVKNGGHSLWRRCLDADVDPVVRHQAWREMERYCKKDVALLPALHGVLVPWINGPHMGLLSGVEGDSCKCGSVNLEKRGTAFTSVSAFQQYRCRDCGAWPRGSKALGRTTTRGQ